MPLEDVDGNPISAAKSKLEDFEGNPINIKAALEEFGPEKTYFGSRPVPMQGEQRLEPPEGIGSKITGFIRNELPAALGFLGGFAGKTGNPALGILSAAAGGGLGSAIQQGGYGRPIDTSEIVKEALRSGTAEGAGRAIAPFIPAVTSSVTKGIQFAPAPGKEFNPTSKAGVKILEFFGGKSPDPQVLAQQFGKYQEKIPLSYSQLSGNKLAGVIESLFAPGVKQKQLTAAAAAIKEQAIKKSGELSKTATERLFDPEDLAASIRIPSAQGFVGNVYEAKGIKNILNSPKRTAHVMLQAPGNRSSLQTFRFQNIMQEAYDEGTQRFNRDKLLSLWKDPAKETVNKLLYTAHQRADLDQFFKTAAEASNIPSYYGESGIVFRGAAAVLSLPGLAPGAVDVLLGEAGSVSSSEKRALATVGVIIAGNQFAKKVLLNPRISRMATGLLKQPATNPATMLKMRTIFHALNGTEAILNMGDKQIPARIENGTVKPIVPSQ